MTKLIKQLQDHEWYQALLEELKAIMTEGIFNMRDIVLTMKWNVGNRILEDKDKHQKGITYLVQHIAANGKWQERELWNCIKFNRKYPGNTFEEAITKKPLPEGKNTSWNKICNLYLSGKVENCQHKWQEQIYWKCEKCSQKRFTKST